MSTKYGVSVSTIQRKLSQINPELNIIQSKDVIIQMDTTYLGRDFGVVVFKDAHTKEILWYKFVKYETLSDYKEGIISLEKAGFTVLGFVCDGFKVY